MSCKPGWHRQSQEENGRAAREIIEFGEFELACSPLGEIPGDISNERYILRVLMSLNDDLFDDLCRAVQMLRYHYSGQCGEEVVFSRRAS